MFRSLSNMFTAIIKPVTSVLGLTALTAMLSVVTNTGAAEAAMLKVNNTNLCLHRNGDNTLSFTTCQNGNVNMDFRRNAQDIIASNGLCVGRANSNRAPQNKDRAILMPCNQSPTILNGNGEMYLWKYANFALDAYGNTPFNGSNAQFYTRGNSTQQLRFVDSVGPANSPPVVNVPVVQQPVYYKINKPPSSFTACNGNRCEVSSGPIWVEVIEWANSELTKYYAPPVGPDGFQTAWTLPDKQSITWDEAAANCNRLNSVNDGRYYLTWKNGLKTCGVMRPIPTR
jgi:hypothetical protein